MPHALRSLVGRARFALAVVCFAGVLAGMAAYARSAYWLCDDAYISFRYAWNLVHGHGLVFNAGERVEGYTNFLWVVELAAIWKLAGIPPEIASVVLGALYTVGAVLCTIALARSGPFPERGVFAAGAALFLLATSRTWAVWCTSGLETRQFTFFVLLGAWSLRGAIGKPRRAVLAALAFSAAELTRPEGLLLGSAAFAWLAIEAWRSARAGRSAWRELVCFVAPFACVVAAHYLWRHAYYGEWLPNTYYAKHVRAWPEAGVRYLAAAAIETGAWMLVPLAVLGGIARARRGDRTHVLGLSLVAPHALYLAYIGGDHFELRPLDFYWPFLAVAAIEGVLALSAAGSRWLDPQRAPNASLRAAVPLVAVVAVYGSSVQIAKDLALRPRTTREQSFRSIVKLDWDNAPALLALPGMELLVPLYDSLQDYCLRRGTGTVWREHEVFWRDELRQWKPYEVTRDAELLPSSTVLTRSSIGVFGYYLASTVLIDQKGLTDRHVARADSPLSNDQRYMAHDRQAEPTYLFSRGLNAVPAPAATTCSDALRDVPFALRLGDGVWMPLAWSSPGWRSDARERGLLWGWTLAREIGCFRAGEPHEWIATGCAFGSGVRDDLPQPRIITWPLHGEARHGFSSRGAHGRGRVLSPPFLAEPGTLLEVRLAGPYDGRTGVRVLEAACSASAGAGARVLATLHSTDETMLKPERLHLTQFAGQRLRLELFDESESCWIAAADAVVLARRKIGEP